jgi:hypothetical protein
MLLCNAELVSYISLYVELVVAGMSRLCNCAYFGGSPGKAAYKKNHLLVSVGPRGYYVHRFTDEHKSTWP